MMDHTRILQRPLAAEDVHHIVADRRRYDEILYTPLAEAYAELRRRRRNPKLTSSILALVHGNVPEPLRTEPKAVLSRSVMSPNHEVRRFAHIVEQFGELKPLYWEYHSDKFTSNNETKRMLGKLYFFHGRGRNNGLKQDLLNIIDFSASDGKRFSSLRTLWGQRFIDFHHDFFDTRHLRLSHTFFESSPWLHAQGGRAEAYYLPFLALFIRHGILFENVLLNKQEVSFTKNVFFPTFLTLYRMFGMKPLIVQVTPTSTEEHRFWTCYPGADRHYVTDRMQHII